MNVADTALYGALTGDATLMAMIPGGIHKLRAPYATTFPLIVFHWEGKSYEGNLGDSPAWVSGQLVIKAVTEGLSTVSAYDILDRVETVLASPLSLSGRTSIALMHVSDPAEYAEDAEGGLRLMHVVSTWNWYIQ